MTKKPKAPEIPLICVVDDDASVAESTQYLIRTFGFRSKTFASARDFLSSHYVEEVSCLILDIRMPDMGGLELQHRLAESNKRFPVVFVTANANEHEEKHAKECGAVAVLRKPVNEGLLFDAIQAALGRSER